jgi:hypothetical protein
MATTIQVDTTGRRLLWPPICACCGGQADTKTNVNFRKSLAPEETLNALHRVPACSVCKKHRRKTLPWELLWTILLWNLLCIGCVVSIGVGAKSEFVPLGILFFILWCVMLVTAWRKASELLARNANIRAERIMKPTCTAADFVSFYRFHGAAPDRAGNMRLTHTFDKFTFSNDAYARAFSDLNSGLEVHRPA